MLFLIAINTAAVVGLAHVGHSLLDRIGQRERDNSALKLRAEQAEAETARVRIEAREEIRRIEQQTDQRLQGIRTSLDQARDADTRAAAETSTMLKDLEERELARRREAMSSLENEIKTLNERFHTSLSRPASVEETFRRVQQEADTSIFLIHCEFTYRTKADGEVLSEQTGTGWGTGFVISEEGHIVTNKHVVQPWKFDTELAAMEALGQIEIVTDKVKLCAWPATTRCMDDLHNLLIENGFNNTTRGNLALLATAPDHMIRKPADISGGVEYPVHELDNNDLAILKATGGKFHPLACQPVRKGGLRKLDRVMALGFPRGHRGLEAGIAETSPSLGTVRKVEDTIHITASIIPGNSGGPLFNEDGKVVGIATRIYSETLGICLKIDHALDLLASVVPAKDAERPEVGAAGAPVPDVAHQR